MCAGSQHQQLPPDIRELCELVHGEAEVFSMLKAYFDESGIHGNSPVCIVAGFVAKTQACGKLSYNWRGLLSKYGLECFHAKEYAGHTGEFRRSYWTSDYKEKFEIDALAVVNDADELDQHFVLIGAAVNTADFLRLSIDERRWLTGGFMSKAGRWKRQGAPSKPYFLAFQQAVLDAVKFSQNVDYAGRFLGTGDVVHFVFDRQHEYEHSARAIFNAMKRAELSVKGRLGDVVFSAKDRALALQVADFIAYESFCYLSNRLLHDADMLRRASWRLFNRDRRTVYMDTVELRRLLDECPPRPNALFTLPDPVDKRIARGIRGSGIPPTLEAW